MSFTIFLAFCILGLDFMIYVLFQWLYGDRRSVIARRVAQQRKAAQAEAAGLILFPARKSPPVYQEPDESTDPHDSANELGNSFCVTPTPRAVTAPLIESYRPSRILLTIGASGSPDENCIHTRTALGDWGKKNSARDRG